MSATTGFKSRVVVKDAYTLLMERLEAGAIAPLVETPVEPRKAAAAAKRGTRQPRAKAGPKQREPMPRLRRGSDDTEGVAPRRYAAWDDESRVRSVLDRADVHQVPLSECVQHRHDQKLQGPCGAEYHVEAFMGGV